MNTLYIGVGMTLILALLAALVGPLFVDWGTWRTVFEAEASRVVGLQVTVIGDVDARLLPSPRIRFGDVVIGDIERPLVRVARFELDLEAAPLLRGEVHIGEVKFDQPIATLDLDRDGRLVLPARRSDGLETAAVAIDRLDITGGRLIVTDARNGGRQEISRIAAVGSAASLAGPWRLDGSGRRAGRDLSFHLAGGRGADGATAVKLQASRADDPATLTLTLDLALRDGAAGPSLAGRAVVERRPPDSPGDLAAALASFRLEATLAGDARAITTSGITLDLGPEERAARLTGDGRITFGAEPSFDLSLAGQQIDIDRLIAGAPTGLPGAKPAAAAMPAIVPASVAVEALALLGGVADPVLPGRLHLDVQGLVVGGGAVQETSIDLRTRPGGLTVERFDTRLPGHARLTAAGRLGLGRAPRFDGHGEVEAEQPATLAGWWRGEPVGDRIEPSRLSADISAESGVLRAETLALKIGRAEARGFIDWREATGAHIGLSAERLELDAAARLARLFLGTDAARRPVALRLDLDAGQVVIGGVTAKGVAIGVHVAAADVTIDRLAVADLAGARLTGSGRIADPLHAPRGTLDLRLEAARPAPPAVALATLAGLDPAVVERIGVAAAAAAPLDLTLRFDGRSAEAGTALAVGLRGYAAGAELTADARFDGAIDDPRHATVKLDGRLAGPAASPALVKLLGAGAATGAIAVRVQAEGRPVDGLKVSASAEVGKASAGLDGRAVFAAEGLGLDGRLHLATPDATALGALLGRPIAVFEGRLPVDLTATVAGTWPKLTIGEITGRLAETTLRGAGTLDLTRSPATVDGRLDLDRLDLVAASEALVGGAILADGTDAKAIWATTPFAGLALDAVVTGTLALAIDRGLLEDGGLDRLRARLVLRPGEVGLSGIEAAIAGGRLAGDVQLRRAETGVAELSGRLSLAGAPLGDLVWRRTEKPAATRPAAAGPPATVPTATGTLAGDVGFTATGRSAAALVSGLAGEGRVEIKDLRASGLGGEAFGATRLALGETTPTPAAVEKLFRPRLTAGETRLDRLDIPFNLQTGVARSGRLAVETPTSRVTGRLAIDLTRLTLIADATLEPAGAALTPTQTPISHATPAVGLAFRGPLAAPATTFDVAPFVAHLTLYGFEREIERVEALQQDIAERARFARERRRLDEIRAAQEVARREAEARRAAAAAAARTLPPPPPEAPRPPDAPKPTPPVATPEPDPAPTPDPVPPAATPPAATAPVPPAATTPAPTAPVQPAPMSDSVAPPALPPLSPLIVVPPAPAIGTGDSRPLSILPPDTAAP